MTEPDLLYVPDLAKKLGRTESAIRSAVQRGDDWIPPRIEMGTRLAWSRETVNTWLKARETKPIRSKKPARMKTSKTTEGAAS